MRRPVPVCCAVLGVSGVLESHSLNVAVNTLRRRAAQQGMSLLAYIKTGADPAAVAVMMEDSAAVAGLVIAGGCLALCQVGSACCLPSALLPVYQTVQYT